MAPPPHENGVSALSDLQHLYVNGSYTPSSDGETFPVLNPMTGQSIYSCAAATEADYTAAIAGAHAAFASWSRASPSSRRLILLRAADILESYLETDAPRILAEEVSATRAWITLNIKAGAGMLRDNASLATSIKGEIVPADRPGTSILVERGPVGVVFSVSPWNAPVTLTVRAIACPLICGNTVVLKPSEHSPKSQHLVVRALLAAGLPPGCIHFLPTSPGRAPGCVAAAIADPRVLRVTFTGSDRVGAIIASLAAKQIKQVVLELGGKAPAVVLDDADVEDTVESVVFGALSNSGQICMSTERVILQGAVTAEFIPELLRRVAKVRWGNILEDPDVSVSGLFTPESAQRLLGLMRSAVEAGATLLYGDLTASGPTGTIVMPHVLSGVTPAMDIFHKESFGPVICITECDTETQAIDLANGTSFSLAASVFSRDVMRAMDVARQVRAGSCHVNGPTVYIEPPLPNGGTGGSSGYGRFGGMAGVEEFTERKIVSLVRKGMKYPF